MWRKGNWEELGAEQLSVPTLWVEFRSQETQGRHEAAPRPTPTQVALEQQNINPGLSALLRKRLTLKAHWAEIVATPAEIYMDR